MILDQDAISHVFMCEYHYFIVHKLMEFCFVPSNITQEYGIYKFGFRVIDSIFFFAISEFKILFNMLFSNKITQ